MPDNLGQLPSLGRRQVIYGAVIVCQQEDDLIGRISEVIDHAHAAALAGFSP